MKKIAGLLIALCMVFSVASCGFGPSNKQVNALIAELEQWAGQYSELQNVEFRNPKSYRNHDYITASIEADEMSPEQFVRALSLMSEAKQIVQRRKFTDLEAFIKAEVEGTELELSGVAGDYEKSAQRTVAALSPELERLHVDGSNVYLTLRAGIENPTIFDSQALAGLAAGYPHRAGASSGQNFSVKIRDRNLFAPTLEELKVHWRADRLLSKHLEFAELYSVKYAGSKISQILFRCLPNSACDAPHALMKLEGIRNFLVGNNMSVTENFEVIVNRQGMSQLVFHWNGSQIGRIEGLDSHRGKDY